MKIAIPFLVFTVALAACMVIPHATSGAEPGKAPQTKQSGDAEFVTLAYQLGLKQIELGKQAAEKATLPEVKKFAALMVSEHTKSNEQLKAASPKGGGTEEATLNALDQTRIQTVTKSVGQDFDKMYLEEAVKDHTRALALFEEATKNSAVAAFAEKTLPAIRQQLVYAEGLLKKL